MRISDWSSYVCSSDLIERCRLAGNFKLPRSEIHEGRPVPDHIEQAVGGAGGAGAAERQVIGSAPHLEHGGRLARKAEDQIERAIMVDAGRYIRLSYEKLAECNIIGSGRPVGSHTTIEIDLRDQIGRASVRESVCQ